MDNDEKPTVPLSDEMKSSEEYAPPVEQPPVEQPPVEPKKKKKHYPQTYTPAQKEAQRDAHFMSKEERAEKERLIKLLAVYYNCNLIHAREKYKELGKDELEKILKDAEDGKMSPDVLTTLKCPLCNGDMGKRNGRLGEFWGCLKFPHCTGTRPIKAVNRKVTPEQQQDASYKMQLTLKYVEDIGGLENARRWLNIVATAMESES